MSDTTITNVSKKDIFPIIKETVNEAADFVRPTYGPASNKMIIKKLTHRMVVDDGVQILRDLEFEDPVKQSILDVFKEVAISTNDRVGDGTSGATLMTQSLINEVDRKSSFDGRKVELELKSAADEAIEQLQKMKREIKTKAELKKAALVSFDDEQIAEMIAETYLKLGKDGIITVDKSPTLDTYVETTDGISIDRGYISPYMITNPERMEAVIEKPYILVTDYRITDADDIVAVMELMAENKKRDLVVICENMEQAALSTAVVNKVQGKFNLIAINAPSKGNRKVALEDIALMLGARFISEGKGDSLSNVGMADLGKADKFICNDSESTIICPKGNKKDITIASTSIRTAIESTKDKKKKKELELRLARFENTIAVIKVGAPTENEQKALKYKVDDAVNAVKAAYRGGVVAGAGIALANINTSSKMFNEALKYPSRQLRENMGLDSEPVLDLSKVENVVSGKTGDFMAVGVIDPVDVLVAAIESAVSITSMLITSCGALVESPKKPPIVNE
jgi:chaperonin GroEL